MVTFKYLTFLYVKTYLFLFFNCIKKHPSTENRCNFKIYKVTYSKLLLFLPTYGGSKNKQAYCILKAYRSSHQSCSIKKLRNIHGKKPVMKNICEWVLFELSNFLHINILSTLSNFFFFFENFQLPAIHFILEVVPIAVFKKCYGKSLCLVIFLLLSSFLKLLKKLKLMKKVIELTCN